MQLRSHVTKIALCDRSLLGGIIDKSLPRICWLSILSSLVLLTDQSHQFEIQGRPRAVSNGICSLPPIEGDWGAPTIQMSEY